MSTEETAPAPAAEGTVLTPNNAAGPEGNDPSSSSPSGDVAPNNPASSDDPKGQSEGEPGADGQVPEAAAAAVAPENYKDFKTDDVQVNDEGMTRFKEFAKVQNMPQEQAQETLDYIAKEMPQFMQDLQQQQMDAYMQQTKDWKDAYEKDPNIGGVKMKQTETEAQRALQYLNDPDLVSVLDAYNAETNPNGMGLGNHRAIINILAQFGRSLAEDTHEGGDQNLGGGNTQTPEERWYPNEAIA